MAAAGGSAGGGAGITPAEVADCVKQASKMELATAHAKAWLAAGWGEHRRLCAPPHRLGVAAGVAEGYFYIKSASTAPAHCSVTLTLEFPDPATMGYFCDAYGRRELIDTYSSGGKIYASTTVALGISVGMREWLDKHFAVLPTYALAGGKDAALVATAR